MELVPTKLPHYILPIYPAIAVLMGIMLANHIIIKIYFLQNIRIRILYLFFNK